MKKLLLNPMTIVVLVLGSALIISNTCCTGKASNNDKYPTADRNTSTSISENNSGVIILDASNFDDKIKSGVVLVDFWATWCPPCRMMGPVIESVGTEMSGKATVCKLDVDQAQTIANRYNVVSIPTMIIFKDGKIAKQFVGITSKEDIINAMNNQLK